MKQRGILFYLLTYLGERSEVRKYNIKNSHNFSSYKVSGKGLALKMEESCLFACQEVN